MAVMNKKEYISSGQLFCLLFVFRLEALLTKPYPITKACLLSLLLELGLSLALSVGADFISKRKKPEESLFVRIIFGIYLIALAVFRIYAYLRFSGEAVKTDVSPVIILVMLTVFSLYAAHLGIQALARFSFVAVIFIACAYLAAVALNANNYTLSDISITRGSFSFIADWLMCLNTPVVYILLCHHTKGNSSRALYASTAVAYSAAFIVYGLCILSMGAAAGVYSYPVFRFVQIGYIGSFTKPDIIYYATWLMALFLKLGTCFSLCRKEIK
jgi:hypothetical protein